MPPMLVVYFKDIIIDSRPRCPQIQGNLPHSNQKNVLPLYTSDRVRGSIHDFLKSDLISSIRRSRCPHASCVINVIRTLQLVWKDFVKAGDSLFCVW